MDPSKQCGIAEWLESHARDTESIEGRRRQIASELIVRSPNVKGPNFCRVGAGDLERLFAAYDNWFFSGALRRVLRERAAPLTLRISPRLTSAGGKTILIRTRGHGRQHRFEIAISSTLLFGSFDGGQSHIVCGCTVHSRLDAMQRILEHELLHLAELIEFDRSSCSAARFRRAAARIFGHRQSNHELIRPVDRARTERGISPGDRVWFELEGRRVTGVANRITKRATVLVPSDDGQLYSDGARYAKYYVPIDLLQRA